MGRRKQNGHDSEPPAAAPAPAIGDNVADETLRAFEREYVSLKKIADDASDDVALACKRAAENGIDVATFKRVRKIKELTAPEMDVKIQTFTRYTKQLGIFDLIEEFRQGEEREDNAASVAAAERERAEV